MPDGSETFALDDVRDSFIADMHHALQSIETAMAEAAAWSRECGQLRASAISRALTMAADQGHSMLGTSSLVGVRSLVLTGDAFQRLSTAAGLLAIEVVEMAQRMEGLSAGSIRLASDARIILELELAHRPAEALAMAEHAIAALQVAKLPAVEREAALLLEGAEVPRLQEGPAEPAGASAGAAASAPPSDPADNAAVSALASPKAPDAASAASAHPGAALFDFTEEEERIEASEGMALVIVPEDPEHSLLDLTPAAAATRAADPPTPGTAGEFPMAGARQSIAEETRAIFLQEACEILDQLDRLCLHWSASALQEARRLYHTLKGAAATVGEDRISSIAHAIEDRLEAGTRCSADVLLALQAQLRTAVSAPPGATAEIDLRSLTSAPSADTAGSAVPEAGMAIPGAPGALLAHMDRGPAQLPAPLEPPLLEPVREQGGESGGAEFQRSLRVPAERLDHLLAMAGELLLGRNKVEDRVRSLLDLQQELRTGRSRLTAVVEEFQAQHEFPIHPRPGSAARLGLAPELKESAAGDGGGRPLSLLSTPAVVPGVSGATEFGSLEFDAYQPLHILTRQLTEVGDDLAEVQAQVQSEIDAFRDESAGLSRTIGSLQSELTRLRMIPVARLFDRLRLAARAAGFSSGRHAQVETTGEDVHLDKMISESIAGALEHLVRNAFAHGFEPPGDRVAVGKPATGRLLIGARHANGQVELEIGDDGRGLDLATLRARGIAMGIIPPNAAADSPAVRDLVFVPGLSTAGGTDVLSGRGVGCDAVRRTVQRLGGSIGVRSTFGRGATFTITLPLTLAITRVLIITCAGESYALPLGYIESIVEPGHSGISEGPTGRRMHLGGAWLPLHALSDAVHPGMPQEPGPMVILRIGDRRTALTVERVQLHREVVVHALGELLAGHPLISGVTVGTGGELVPILDLPGVVDALQHGQRIVIPRAPLPLPLPGLARVLYADDSLSVRKVAERALREAGHPVVLAHDGEEALERIRQGHIDMVFTDLEMPRMNGLELVRAIRADPGLAGLPVVVVSSRTNDKHRLAALVAGATDFIAKPFTADQLLAATRAHVP